MDGAPAPRAARGSRPLAAAAAAAAALSLLCLLPVVRNGFVAWDDPELLLRNPDYRGFGLAQLRWMATTLHLGHYQPVAWLSFALDHALWGMDPTGYHLTSLCLHAANVALFALLVAELLAARPGAAAPRGWAVAAGALFFGVHPLRVESVAWASDRGNLLATGFALLATLAHLRALRRPRGGRARLRWRALSLALAAASLASRAWAMTLPVVLLVLDAWPLRRLRGPDGRLDRAVLLEKLPYGLLALPFAALALLAKVAFDPEAIASGVAADVSHGPRARLLQAAYGLCFYLGKTLLPLRLSNLYPLESQLASPAPVFYGCLALTAVATLWLVALRRRCPSLLAAWVAYAVLAAPGLGLVQSGPQIAADRYTYLAGLPWAVLLAGALDAAAARGRGAARAAAAAAALALAGLAPLAAAQTRVWRDSTRLWDHAAAVHPESGLIRFYRANVLRERGDLAAALAEYDRALALGVPRPADLYNNRGVARAQAGEPARAIEDLSRAIRLRPSARAHWNRGRLRGGDDLPGAIADYNAALRLDPAFPEAYRSRAEARERLGALDAARADYERALSVAPPGWSGRAAVARRLRALGEPGTRR